MALRRAHADLQGKRVWLACLAILAVLLLGFGLGGSVAPVLGAGFVLTITAVITLLFSLRLADDREAHATWLRSIMTILLALAFLNAELFSDAGLATFIATWVVLALVHMVLTAARPSLLWIAWALAGIGAAGAVLVDFRATHLAIVLGIALLELAVAGRKVLAARLQGAASSLVDALDAGVDNDAYRRFQGEVVASEPMIRQVDIAWVLALSLVLFDIHLNRMGWEGSLGLLPAAVALLGDLVMALLLAFLVVLPVRLWWMRMTRPYEAHHIRTFREDQHGSLAARIRRFWVIGRIRFRIRMRQARFSILSLLRMGLIAGLPLSALITATVPLLGMSWFFDTEKWASISRDKWAERHVEQWRTSMVRAIHPAEDRSLAIALPGTDAGDFSFIVIGDPGQGGLAQRALARRLVETSREDHVRFVVISSDVVYPNGEMQDYEAKFWSPYDGIAKPVLALPGNHDWYDGLEGFAATFFTKDAARRAISARLDGGVQSERGLAHADRLVAQVEKLRSSYAIPVQQQSSPYFQVATEHFVLIGVDTGVAPGIDQTQLAWLRRTLEQARGKTVMVLLGHPLFAAGRNRAAETPGLRPLLALLREARVSIVMAGDTHDFEYYKDDQTFGHTMHHFVNGGGGAYVSIGTAFGFPVRPVSDEWAFYPSRRAISEKIEGAVPPWARPLWWWTREFDGYPLSSETLSSAFDFNESPFLQSFTVVRVERSANRIRVLPYGVKGRLRWRDFQMSGTTRRDPDAYAEWSIPMTARR